ncbi:MAG: polysaccharide lyase family 7 protein [Burkholderiales bacterium]|nr:polysaccharide lyase family 7 protein [Burkholderiales bacterium]
MKRTAIWVTCAALIGCSGVPQALRTSDSLALSVLEPATGNRQRIDLRHWKLTLPDAMASEVQPDRLSKGYQNDSFRVESSGSLLFTAKSDGGSTANAKYPRSELREMINPANKADNWTTDGTHLMTLRQELVSVPPGVRVIVFQIHGVNTDGSNAPPLVKAQWKDSALQFLVKAEAKGGKDILYNVDGNFPLGSTYEGSLKVEHGRLLMTVNGKTYIDDFVARDPAWKSLRYYFKAGNYLQDNSKGDARSVAAVRIHDLAVRHE